MAKPAKAEVDLGRLVSEDTLGMHEAGISQPATTEGKSSGPAGVAARETNGMTSRLVLLYVERQGGPEAVRRVLERAGLAGAEERLMDEGHWFSYDEKIQLFGAAAGVLDDPRVTRSIGQTAIEANVGEGLKVGLRALGSPRFLYQNVVRANGKFTGSHSMEIAELGADHATIAYRDLTDQARYDHLDCEYNRGLLSCAPRLFGLPAASVSHPVCGCEGGEACVYEVRWQAAPNEVRFALGTGAVGGVSLLGAAFAAPALLPIGIAVATASVAAIVARATLQRRARWRTLEAELRERTNQSERLSGSLQDLVSELRLDEVLAKVTSNASAAAEGKEFALLVSEDGTPSCRGSTGLPKRVTEPLEEWARRRPQLDEPTVIEDVAASPTLVVLQGSEERGGFGSICAVPLSFRGQTLGMLIALATQVRTFLPNDVALIQSYANQAAIAIANARLYQSLEELASRDHLTGLGNHREFHVAMDRELVRCRRHDSRFALVSFDLDRFKRVNDTEGHAAGDHLLSDVGEAMGNAGRDSDPLFRVGGDEFAMLMPETDREGAWEGAERIREAIRTLPRGLDVSFGVATFPGDGSTKDRLIEIADERLYEMKGRRSIGSPARA